MTPYVLPAVGAGRPTSFRQHFEWRACLSPFVGDANGKGCARVVGGCRPSALTSCSEVEKPTLITDRHGVACAWIPNVDRTGAGKEVRRRRRLFDEHQKDPAIRPPSEVSGRGTAARGALVHGACP